MCNIRVVYTPILHMWNTCITNIMHIWHIFQWRDPMFCNLYTSIYYIFIVKYYYKYGTLVSKIWNLFALSKLSLHKEQLSAIWISKCANNFHIAWYQYALFALLYDYISKYISKWANETLSSKFHVKIHIAV